MKYSLPLPLRICLGSALLAVTAFPAEPKPAPAHVANTPAELSAADFFRPPLFTSPKLNPSGSHLALLMYEEQTDSTGIRLFEFATNKVTGLRGTEEYDLRDFRWVGDDRIVYRATRDNIYASGLYTVLRDRIDRPILLNRRDVVDVISAPAARPNHLLVWVRRSAKEQGRSGPLLEIDLARRYDEPFDTNYTRVFTSVEFPPGDSVLRWFQDRAGEIRYAISQAKGEPKLYRRNGERKWTQIGINLDELEPLAVDVDPQVLFVARLGESGRRELVRYNTANGQAGPVLHSDDKYDFGHGSIMYSNSEQDVIGLAYAQQAPVHVWLRPEDAALQRGVDAALPANRVNLIVSRSRDGSRVVVRSSSDRHPGTLYLIERKTGDTRIIANLAPWLPEQLLGEVRLMTFPTRDGLKLDSYVTLPVNYDPAKPAPMIVLPHGGPWARDTWGYDPESQFFASRGYIVFRPNYRGSTGYRAEISQKPRMEFRKMHEDVTDGVHALIKSGIADPKHIAICGASFGGYLAICGAAFEPDLYQCAITISGIFDWARVMREAHASDPDSSRYDHLLRELGDPKKQGEKFEAMSPILSATQVKIPVFIAHGEEDQVADSSQSHRLAKALEKSGVPCETMFVHGEAHGFATLKNRVELFQRIEAFLKKNL